MTPEAREFSSRIFAALSNPSRLQILEYLSENPASVNEIAEALELKQSITSQHLSSLLSAGVVVCKPQGNQRVYSLRGPRIRRIIDLVEDFYQAHLDALRGLIDMQME